MAGPPIPAACTPHAAVCQCVAPRPVIPASTRARAIWQGHLFEAISLAAQA
jgi:hypothetical protein